MDSAQRRQQLDCILISGNDQRRAARLASCVHVDRVAERTLEALTLARNTRHAYGWTYVSMFNLDTGKPIHEFTERALDAGTRAVELDDQDPWGHLVRNSGTTAAARAGVTHLLNAIALNPSFALGHAGLGYAVAAGRQPERGLEALEQAHPLSPHDPFIAIYAPTVRYMALFALGRYQETIEVCRATAALNSNHAGAWRLMTVSLALLGRIDEAKAALAHTLMLQPDLSIDHVDTNTVYAAPADRSRFLEGLRKGGAVKIGIAGRPTIWIVVKVVDGRAVGAGWRPIDNCRSAGPEHEALGHSP